SEKGQKKFLVATHIADRVIDIKYISLILNYDIANKIQAGKQQKKDFIKNGNKYDLNYVG
ncbi:unnamed protein product, partial [Rotaria sp. Silwood2]